jgi:hypothetical protein
MIRKALDSASLLLVAVATLLLATAQPAAATFDVQERGTTTTVTQLDTAKLIVVVNFGGGIVVNDGVSIIGYPPATNLVVRGSDALTLSQLDIVMHEALPGSLTLDLPGFNEVTLRGDAATIDGSLNVKGSDASTQILHFGEAGHPVLIKGNAKLDLKKGYDKLDFTETTEVLGNFTGKGVNEIKAVVLGVNGNLTLDVKRESDPLNVTVLSALIVNKSLSLIGGPASDNIGVRAGSVGGSVKIKLGDGEPTRDQFVQPMFSVIDGSFNVQMGTGRANTVVLPNSMVLKGSLSIKASGDQNVCVCNARVEGTSIKYVGGAGRDIIYSQLVAPRAKASFKMSGGDDGITLEAPPQLARLDVDFGDGADLLVNPNGFALPPGKIVGLP